MRAAMPERDRSPVESSDREREGMGRGIERVSRYGCMTVVNAVLPSIKVAHRQGYAVHASGNPF
jgi:hypothetical protein